MRVPIFVKVIWVMGVLISLGCTPQTGTDYKGRISHYRDSLDKAFAAERTSILLPEDRENFEGLHYYPIDSGYRLPIEFVEDIGEPFKMHTTTDRLPIYRKYGVIHFVIEGDTQELTIYQNMALLEDPDYADYLFCPFKDGTNVEETYGGGRYLDLRMRDLEEGYVDFNMAYNPYCAYNYKYSCPTIPPENRLEVPIRAGVKKFH